MFNLEYMGSTFRFLCSADQLFVVLAVGVDLVAVGEDPVAEGHLEILAVEVHLEAPVMEGHLKAQAVEMNLEARAVEMHLEVRAAEMHLEARTVEMHLEAQAVETTPVDREEGTSIHLVNFGRNTFRLLLLPANWKT